MSNNGPVRAAGVLLLAQTSPPQFLLMRHRDRWDLPKGYCDGDETYFESAQRELWEETGVDPGTCRFDEHFYFDVTYEVSYHAPADETVQNPPAARYPEVFQKNVRYFLARLPEVVTIEASEHESYQWFTWSPPHNIQSQTIDPLLAAVAAYLGTRQP